MNFSILTALSSWAVYYTLLLKSALYTICSLGTMMGTFYWVWSIGRSPSLWSISPMTKAALSIGAVCFLGIRKSRGLSVRAELVVDFSTLPASILVDLSGESDIRLSLSIISCVLARSDGAVPRCLMLSIRCFLNCLNTGDCSPPLCSFSPSCTSFVASLSINRFFAFSHES
jgi:hypothetical protein